MLDANGRAAVRIGPTCDVAGSEDAGHACLQAGVDQHAAVDRETGLLGKRQSWPHADADHHEIGLLFLSQRIFRRWGARRLLVFSLGITVLRWWVTALWPDSLPVMIAAQATHAFSFAAFFAAAMLLLAEYFPGRHNGHGQGVFYGLSSGVGGVIGALLAGQLWRFGGQVAFAVSGFIALAACGVAWHWLLGRRSRVAVEAA